MPGEWVKTTVAQGRVVGGFVADAGRLSTERAGLGGRRLSSADSVPVT